MNGKRVKHSALACAGILVVCAAVIGVVRFRGGKGVSGDGADPAADVTTLRAKAEAGDAAAQNAMGDLYAKGDAVPQSYGDAFKWYRSAAEQGWAEAQYNLAVLYETGEGVTRDEGAAVKWHRKAAEQGHSGAAYNLGAIYSTGRGVPPDPVEATKWYRQAAEQGDALAQYNLARRYEVGKGVPVDRVEAYKWHKLASRQGMEDAGEALERLKGQMTRDEIAEGKRRADAFMARKAWPALAR